MPKEEKAGPGRKPRGDAAAKMIGVRVTDAERTTWEAAAKRSSMSLGEWIRHCCSLVLGRKRG